MPQWDAAQYLRFADERTRPSRDLAAQIPIVDPARIIDLGCGPGNSTRILAERFPNAEVTGADVDANMLARATQDNPDLSFIELDVSGDLSVYDSCFDVAFSNACLHWVPDHQWLLPRLMELVAPGGCLAVQMPLMSRQKMYREVIWPTVRSHRWRDPLDIPQQSFALEPERYLPILQGCSSGLSLWQTTYYHLMPSAEAVLEWYKGSGLRPYLERLDETRQAELLDELLEQVRKAFAPLPSGEVALPFPRLFFVATR